MTPLYEEAITAILNRGDIPVAIPTATGEWVLYAVEVVGRPRRRLYHRDLYHRLAQIQAAIALAKRAEEQAG